MVIYTDQAKRIVIAVFVVVAVAGALFVLKLRGEAPRETSITGIVEAPDGTPIDGATVFVLYSLIEDPRDAVPTPLRTQSQAGGAFKLSGLQIRPCHLVAIHPRHCDSPVVPVRPTSEGAGGVRLRLTQGGQIEGSVDPSQGPIANRAVLLQRGGHTWRSTTTDESGRFKFEGVSPQEIVIELKPPGYHILEGTNIVMDPGPGTRHRITIRVGQTTTVDFGKN
jgi:hypothetical protein